MRNANPAPDSNASLIARGPAGLIELIPGAGPDSYRIRVECGPYRHVGTTEWPRCWAGHFAEAVLVDFESRRGNPRVARPSLADILDRAGLGIFEDHDGHDG